MENIIDHIEYFASMVKSKQSKIYVNFPFSFNVLNIFFSYGSKSELINISPKKYMLKDTYIPIPEKKITIYDTLNNLANDCNVSLKNIIKNVNNNNFSNDYMYSSTYENLIEYVCDKKISDKNKIINELFSFIVDIKNTNVDNIAKLLSNVNIMASKKDNNILYNITTRNYEHNESQNITFNDIKLDNNYEFKKTPENIEYLYGVINQMIEFLGNYINNISNRFSLDTILYKSRSSIMRMIPNSIKKYYTIFNILQLMTVNLKSIITIIGKDKDKIKDCDINGSITEIFGEFALIIKKMRENDDGDDFKEYYSTYEFMKGFFIRDVQKTIIKNIISDFVNKKFYSYNMLMGSGKTSVVLPLVTHIINSKHNTPVIAVVPQTLIKQTVSDIYKVYGHFYENTILVDNINNKSVSVVSDTYIKTCILKKNTQIIIYYLMKWIGSNKIRIKCY